jgi:hypothetical protein
MEGVFSEGDFLNNSMGFGEGKSFSYSSMVFGESALQGKQNKSMIFQVFPSLTRVAPISFLSFFKQNLIVHRQ